MSKRLHIQIIAAALPPRLDGIGDYTACLARELAKTTCVTVLLPEGRDYAPIPGVGIRPAFEAERPSSYRRILQAVEEDKPDWLLLQYNPFCYGRWGRNLELPRVMRHVKRRCPRTRLAVMVHEPYVPLTNWKHAVMATWQCPQFWSLGRSADCLLFSIDPWARKFTRWFPGKPVIHLPVGANVPRVCIPRSEARQRLGIDPGRVVLGVFGTLNWTRLLGQVRSAADAVAATGAAVKVLYMGPNGKEVRQAMGHTPLLADGPLEAEEVSRRLAAVDIYLSPFHDGVSTRRSSFMAALQQGIAVVGTRGYLTDETLRAAHGQALLLADTGDAEGFNAQVLRLACDVALRERLGEEAALLYEREFSWPAVAAQLLGALR